MQKPKSSAIEMEILGEQKPPEDTKNTEPQTKSENVDKKLNQTTDGGILEKIKSLAKSSNPMGKSKPPAIETDNLGEQKPPKDTKTTEPQTKEEKSLRDKTNSLIENLNKLEFSDIGKAPSEITNILSSFNGADFQNHSWCELIATFAETYANNTQTDNTQTKNTTFREAFGDLYGDLKIKLGKASTNNLKFKGWSILGLRDKLLKAFANVYKKLDQSTDGGKLTKLRDKITSLAKEEKPDANQYVATWNEILNLKTCDLDALDESARKVVNELKLSCKKISDYIEDTICCDSTNNSKDYYVRAKKHKKTGPMKIALGNRNLQKMFEYENNKFKNESINKEPYDLYVRYFTNMVKSCIEDMNRLHQLRITEHSTRKQFRNVAKDFLELARRDEILCALTAEYALTTNIMTKPNTTKYYTKAINQPYYDNEYRFFRKMRVRKNQPYERWEVQLQLITEAKPNGKKFTTIAIKYLQGIVKELEKLCKAYSNKLGTTNIEEKINQISNNPEFLKKYKEIIAPGDKRLVLRKLRNIAKFAGLVTAIAAGPVLGVIAGMLVTGTELGMLLSTLGGGLASGVTGILGISSWTETYDRTTNVSRFLKKLGKHPKVMLKFALETKKTN